jgi:hypothetical protein
MYRDGGRKGVLLAFAKSNQARENRRQVPESIICSRTLCPMQVRTRLRSRLVGKISGADYSAGLTETSKFEAGCRDKIVFKTWVAISKRSWD